MTVNNNQHVDDETEHYLSSGDIAKALGVHAKTVSWWVAHRYDTPLPDITLGPQKQKGWMSHRLLEWKRWWLIHKDRHDEYVRRSAK